ncbi:MAG: hypothetical protein WBG11_07830 [Methylocella sp.]
MRTIFLIVDRDPPHRAKKTAAFVKSLGGKLRLYFLPPYAQDRNPDELGVVHQFEILCLAWAVLLC